MGKNTQHHKITTSHNYKYNNTSSSRSEGFSGTSNNGTPFMVSFPYYSHRSGPIYWGGPWCLTLTVPQVLVAAPRSPTPRGPQGLGCKHPSFLEKTIWVFPKILPQNGWFISETPIKMDDFGGKTPYFWKHPYPIQSMGLEYLPTWIVDFYAFHVGKYVIHGILWLWQKPN